MPTKRVTTKNNRKVTRANGHASKAAPFKLTYATMFNPPETMHAQYEKALARTKANLGRDYGMLINGKERYAIEKFEDRSPINIEWVLINLISNN